MRQLIGWWPESGTATHWASCPTGTQASLRRWTGQLAVWPINAVLDPNLCPMLSGFVHENVKWRAVLISIIHIHVPPPPNLELLSFLFPPQNCKQRITPLGWCARTWVLIAINPTLLLSVYIWFLVLKTHRFPPLSLWGGTQVCLLRKHPTSPRELNVYLGFSFDFLRQGNHRPRAALSLGACDSLGEGWSGEREAAPLALVNVVLLSVCVPEGCFSLTPKFWDFCSAALSLASCLVRPLVRTVEVTSNRWPRSWLCWPAV